MFTPVGTPAKIIRHMSEELGKVVQRSDIAMRLAVDGTDAITGTPEQFANHIKKEYDRWKRIIDDAGIRGD